MGQAVEQGAIAANAVPTTRGAVAPRNVAPGVGLVGATMMTGWSQLLITAILVSINSCNVPFPFQDIQLYQADLGSFAFPPI
jgi:hypothetical protein